MQVIEISARNVQLEKRGAFGKGKVTAKIPAFSAHLPEVKLEKEAMRAYTGYVIQDGHINQLDAHRMIAEGVQSTFRRGFEHRLTEKVRVWAQAYYKNYPHLYDSKTKRLALRVEREVGDSPGGDCRALRHAQGAADGEKRECGHERCDCGHGGCSGQGKV